MDDLQTQSSQDTQETSKTEKTTLLSERFDELKEALEVLYILGNLSGRTQFLKNWPDVAQRIFSAELIRFDTEGTQELERRAELEQEAENARLELLETLDALEDKSADNGVLQLEYVKDLVEGFGREMALMVYSTVIVDRFIPPPAPPPEELSEEMSVGENEDAAVPEEASSVPVDPSSQTPEVPSISTSTKVSSYAETLPPDMQVNLDTED